MALCAGARRVRNPRAPAHLHWGHGRADYPGKFNEQKASSQRSCLALNVSAFELTRCDDASCTAQALQRVGRRDPVILLDEIDKLSKDIRGDPASALLEVQKSPTSIAY